MSARILAIADTYDALTSSRPYREAMDHGEACVEIEWCSGSQLDPQLVSVFLRCVSRREEASFGEIFSADIDQPGCSDFVLPTDAVSKEEKER